MFNKFRNVLYNVVGGIDPLPDLKAVESSAEDSSTLKPKFPYTRPHFLLFHSDEEIQWSACHNIRPIIVPRDITKIPWNSGYAEAVNAGKSRWNEDQACIQEGFLQRPEGRGRCTTPTVTQDIGSLIPDHLNAATCLPYVYFAMFDGHAGVGAAVAAANQLHHILQEKLIDVIDHLLPPLDEVPEHLMEKSTRRGACMWFPGKDVTQESLIIGALESSFWDMDQLIAEDRQKYDMKGGCTALVALFILGKVYVANAGDSRAVLCRNDVAIPLSNDFTPETERQRIRRLAALQPELLGADFTHLDYCRRPSEKDLGKRILYRDVFMTGWAYKTVTKADLKCPVVTGEGKRSRVLATIGVTRGFGDHDLRALYCNNPIKPFLLSQPEVQVLDLLSITESDVLVMGTDGLWDVTSNDKAAEIVQKSLGQFLLTEDTRLKYRYTSAAQDLVMHSRGKLQDRNWRTADGKAATIDDISVFIIPLTPYREEYLLWKNYYDAIHGLYDNTVENTNLGQLALKTSPTTEKVSDSKINSALENDETTTIRNHCSSSEGELLTEESKSGEKDIVKELSKLEITTTQNAVIEEASSNFTASETILSDVSSTETGLLSHLSPSSLHVGASGDDSSRESRQRSDSSNDRSVLGADKLGCGIGDEKESS
ncbi:hypothetical protein R5R35_009407 [Gryllus longicercus]|uniref:PPM-type phosphatase domain-containing protein n=1 Tax=Gryllus longicercus TaxID=2509291 RepID=A0AAN9Z638_9ORTH